MRFRLLLQDTPHANNSEHQYCAETHLSAVIYFRQLTKQYNVSKCLWEMLNLLPPFQAKTNFILAAKRKSGFPQPCEVFVWSMMASHFFWIITEFSLMFTSSLPRVHRFSETMMFCSAYNGSNSFLIFQQNWM